MAGGISDEDIRKVREASDIVALFSDYVPMKQRGRDFWCCCPFHQEKSPSCKVDPSTQLWHCFGCGEGGDIFSFVMKHDGVSFPDAVRTLASRAHIEISDKGGRSGVSSSKKARLMEVCKETAAFYHVQLMRGSSEQAASAREYLSGRGLGGSVPNDWNLGFAPGRGQLVNHLRSKGFSFQDMVDANVATSRDGRYRDRFYDRVMFPIRDAQGDVIAFGGRVIGKGEPKYLNSQETPIFHKSHVLYGLDKAKNALTATGTAIITEGYTDVIALHEGGLRNAVATLGTALTMSHIRLISRYAQKRIVYLFDGDAAGQRAADRALQFIDESMTPEAGRSRIELCAVTLPDNLDPAEFMAARGADELMKYINDAKPLIEYGIERRLAKYDLTRAEGRTRALSDALSVLAPIKTSLLAKDYAIQIAGKAHAREDDVLQKLSELKAPRRYEDEGAASEPSRTSAYSRVPGAQSSNQAAANLPQSELNRLRFERGLLALCAQNPMLALQYADSLAQANWHDEAHRSISDSILATLAAKPEASAAEIVSAASLAEPRATKILTSVVAQDKPVDEIAQYLVDELAISDVEESIASMRAALSEPGSMDADEYEIMFQSVVGMQKALNEMKSQHKIHVD